MRAPLIAVILSVGIAAAPAVASSAAEPSGDQPVGHTGQTAPGPAQSDIIRPPAPVTVTNQVNRRHGKLERRFLRLRNRLNRAIAQRDDRRRPKLLRDAPQLGWSNEDLRRAIRKLGKRIVHIRRQIAMRRAGLTPAVMAVLRRIAACESRGNPRAIGGGGAFRGKYQFTWSTWRAVGGRGDPAAASELEQDRRAAILLRRSGTSPWPVCG